MGYTHYFELTRKSAIHSPCAKMRKLIWEDVMKFLGYLQAGGMKLDIQVLTADTIIFNGVGEAAHETFCFEYGTDYQFCKTARKPYDVAVCGVLLILKAHLGELLRLGSDGSWDKELPNWFDDTDFAKGWNGAAIEVLEALRHTPMTEDREFPDWSQGEPGEWQELKIAFNS